MSQDRMVGNFQRRHFYLAVGRAITAAREAAGMSISDLARESCLTLSTIQHAEEGQTCSFLVAARIAHALDTQLDIICPVDAVMLL